MKSWSPRLHRCSRRENDRQGMRAVRRDEFSPHHKTKDGRNKVCKECVSYRKRICKTFVHMKEGEF